ncbi:MULTISPECIES: hypothetical protein [Eikenella]|uniref:Lipoprotein n=1 Tax=Eikenella longinqua TaxID=1795827 RepID=A0A1A9RXF5_9NEIS|nr:MULTISPECIES: hypothetical protein [Eikenella]OAM28362.1 hypothetical protein A7P95_05215 [Eikenella longinqua]
MKPLFLICSAVLLAACASNAPVVQEESTSYDSNTQARVRLYGQNEKPTIMVSGIDCEAEDRRARRGHKVNVGGSLGDALGSFAGTVKSRSLGMPETAHSKSIGQMNGVLSRAFFREYAVPAGKAVNVQAAYIGLRNMPEPTMQHITIQNEGSCNTRMASFVPQAGRDYEVIGLSGRRCAVSVYEVGAQGQLKPVALQDAVSCRRRR